MPTTSRRTLKRAVLAALLVAGCAGRGGVSERWYMEDTRATAATVAALTTITEGLAEFRRERGIPAVCIGGSAADLRPEGANQVRARWMRTLADRIRGTSAVVAHAAECERAGVGAARVMARDVPALVVVPTVERMTDDLAWVLVFVSADANTRFRYEVRLDFYQGRWETIDVWCDTGRRAGECPVIEARGW